jgi:phosphoglycolate phosphatase
MKDYENYIFDFDGVLVDSKELSFNSINYALQKLFMKPVTKVDFNTKSKIKIIRERNIGSVRSLIILYYAKKYFKKHISEITSCDELLRNIKKIDKNKLIMSTNSKTNILLALEKDASLFTFIKGSIGHSKKHKYLLPYAENSIYITDEVRDIEQCQAVGMDVVAVTWGLDSKENLIHANPTAIIDKPSEILAFI